MDRFLALTAVFLLLFTCACAGGRTAPEDKKIYTTDDLIGRETVYRIYDKKFYDGPSAMPGTVERIEYTSLQYGSPALHRANVYLPCGYDKNGTDRYPVMYFFHGTNETQESFIGDERVKNAIDNMIETGVAVPFIMVFPTYYHDYASRSLDVEGFIREVRLELMPAVEGAYRTFADTTDAAGFASSREYRAFAGYSRGGRMTWEMFAEMRDYAHWFLPMSGGFSTPEEDPVPEGQKERLLSAAGEQTVLYDCFIYFSCGGKRDNALDMCSTLAKLMIADTDHFSYGSDPEADNLMCCFSNELHQTLIARFYLYNAFCDVLRRAWQ